MSDSNKFPDPPYYAVIFSSQREMSESDADYELMAQKMVALAKQQPGYLGMESFHHADGSGVTISYWDSVESIQKWRNQTDHKLAQLRGRAEWYQHYRLRVCLVESDADWSVDEAHR